MRDTARSSSRIAPVMAVAIFCIVGLLLSKPAFSYLSMYTGQNQDHWNFSAFNVNYSINPSAGANISGGSAAAVNAVVASFSTWTTAPNASIPVTRGSDSSITASGFDGINLVCFVCQGDFTKDTTTLAVTITTTADAVGQNTKHGGTSTFAGQILDADILFNTGVQWTTSGQPTNGQEDLQTVATHEIGHFLGLDHSGVVRAVMFPFAPDVLRTLSYDDVAGVSVLYPKSVPDFATGSISGNVSFTSGGGVFGAHVFADSTSASASVWPNVRKSTIGTLSKADGSYVINGLPPDSYTVGAEPLDNPATNGDVSGYATAFGKSSVDAGFNTRFH